GAVVRRRCGHVVADDQLVVVDRRADARNAAGTSVVVCDLTRPQELAGIGADRVEIPGPVWGIDRVAGDRWRRRDVAAGREDPRRGEPRRLRRPNLLFRWLAARVVHIAAGDAPAAEASRCAGLGAASGPDRQHRDGRESKAGRTQVSYSHRVLLRGPV